MSLTEVYLGLGSNCNKSETAVHKALDLIANINDVYNLEVSHLYLTTPVSDIIQPHFVNAVCRIHTSLSAKELQQHLQHIERILGKTPKPKNAPRPIDIDMLFFGLETSIDPDLILPHPRWSERLFVLMPLLDLTSEISIPNPNNQNSISLINLHNYLQQFSNHYGEVVHRIKEEKNALCSC